MAAGELETKRDEPDAERPRLPLLEIGITIGGTLLVAALVLLIPDLREAMQAAIQGDHDQVRTEIDSLGVWGPLLILALTLIHAVVFYPSEIVDAAAGYAYGFFPALALLMVGWTLSGMICWWMGRSVARPLLDGWLGEERFERLEQRIERGGVTLLLAMRLIPILPFSLVSYAAGAARVPLWPFVWTTAVGFLPITAIATYFGTQLEGLSLTDPLVLGSAAAIALLLIGGHYAVRWQSRRAEERPSAGEDDAEAEDGRTGI
ncbi:MAG: hypothetical protein QOE75_2656 [Solirubrobacterales bacterium]|jgi:uncharacterized membrane protein YdjX (TVP38/TMEM64 family)|nr:hypothetical protein [Solirubrobacterales bacterium]